MGGAVQTGLRMHVFSRAAHRALHVRVKHHGIRAARKPAPPPTRASGTGVRKTTRKPRKAARAAGTRRAPPPPPTPTDRGQHAKHTDRPRARC